MFKKYFLNGLLVLLFAFTQIGLVSHEISHFKELSHQTKSDKNTTSEQCGQCIAYAQSANAAPSSPFIIPNIDGSFHFATAYVAHLTTRLNTQYYARAPPTTQEA